MKLFEKTSKRKQLYAPDKTILTAGPSISDKEIRYICDAAKNGWNDHAFDYKYKFQKKFAQYVGAKYAIATTGGTHSLHLGLAALGVGPGDEVIIPEITYFACSDVVKLLGAKPVFVDVLRSTWCLDPEKLKKAITKKTKTIMPVHIYGNSCEIEEIMKIANENNLTVIEDACPAVGTLYKEKNVGSFGDFGAFSFQGAKIMVIGTGGMLTTNSEKLYERALFLNDHGEVSARKFWQTEVGYEFDMSNLQAAFGLAQLERIEEFVKKKREIFDWYFKRLGGIEGISMNHESLGTRTNRWMTSIILDRNFGLTRDEFRLKMKKMKIDTRPFFYPISMFPMYNEQNTPAAHHVGLQGINLPSGLTRTEEEIDYISKCVHKVLKS